jgi:hypothetical protein
MERSRDDARASTLDRTHPGRQPERFTAGPSRPSPPNRTFAIDPIHYSRRDSLKQDAEKVAFHTRPTPARQDAPFPMHRSRIAQTLNVPQRVRFGPSLAAALLNGLFEHPEGVLS